MDTRTQIIENNLANIFYQVSQIDFLSQPELQTKPLFNEDICMTSSAMLYIVYSVEQEFSISMSEDELLNDKTYTFARFVEIIVEKLQT